MIMASCGGTVLLLLVCLAGLLSCAMCHNFTRVPENTTCTLGEAFRLLCIPPGYSGSARWEINGERHYEYPGFTPSHYNERFWLEVTCTRQRHYISITCIAVIRIGTVEEYAPPALIKVEGLPDRVENISLTVDSSSITLVWDPVDPLSNYRVRVYNSTGGETDTNRTPVWEYTVAEPVFVLHSSEPWVSTDQELVFVVTAIREMGMGPPSLPIRANITVEPYTTEAVHTSSPEVTTDAVTTATTAVTTADLDPVPVSSNLLHSSPAVIAGIAAASVITVLLGLALSLLLATIMLWRRGAGRTIEMNKCDAYESWKCTDNGVTLEKKKECASYESINVPENLPKPEEHIYAHILPLN